MPPKSLLSYRTASSATASLRPPERLPWPGDALPALAPPSPLWTILRAPRGRGFQLWHPLDQSCEQAAVLLVRPPLGIQLLPQSADRLVLSLKQHFTIYLSFTATLCLTLVHPYKDTAILPTRAQRSPGL
jgi:hypothetical protein